MKRFAVLSSTFASFVLAAILGFVVYSLAFDSPARALGSSVEGQVWNTDMVGAKGLVGYELKAPAFVPKGFTKRDEMYVIGVNGQTPKDTEQWWKYDADPSIYMVLVQNPTLGGIIGGEPTTVAGYPGQLHISPPGKGRPYSLIVLFWRTGDMAFTLAAVQKDPINEAVLKKIAESIR